MIVNRSRLNVWMLFFVTTVVFVSCKKDPILPQDEEIPASTNRAELTKDSIFLYAKQVYLWNDALPAYEVFNPRKYSFSGTDLQNYNKELFDITQLKLNPQTSKPYEYNEGSTSSPKYSYIFDSANKNPVAYIIPSKSSVDLEGNGNDFGLKVGLYGTSSSYQVYVQAVYPGSPAAKAGITRGDIVNKINTQVIGTNVNSESTFINNAIFNASAVKLEGKKKNGDILSVTLNKASYSSNPVLKEAVLTEGSTKIGYLAFARFSTPENAKTPLAAAFNNFVLAGVTSLVIDLRYNGGGFVSTAEYLLNLIAPSAVTGQVMFVEHYNSTMQSGQAKILANQPLLDNSGKIRYQNGRIATYADVDYSVAENTTKFKKEGTLNGISSVVFIVSGNTASASELVINSLKPYINVKLVGTTTYGKPVGFFPIRIENKYDVYYTMFQTKNSAGQGDYFAGFTPDLADTFDDAVHDFGDKAENYLKKSLSLITTNTLTAKANTSITIKGESVSTSAIRIENLGEENEFKGMIENRMKLNGE